MFTLSTVLFKAARLFSLVSVSVVVVSCGGGGGGSSGGTPTPPASNAAPTLSAVGNQVLFESLTEVVSVSATDTNGDALTFSLEGEDASAFSISSSNIIKFNEPPNFESPKDSDSNNVYELSIKVSDGELSDSESISISVKDALEGRVVDGPVAGSEVSLMLDGSKISMPVLTDDDGFWIIPEDVDLNGAFIQAVGGTDTTTNAELPSLYLVSDIPNDVSKRVNINAITTVLMAAKTQEDKLEGLRRLGISGTPDDFISSDLWEKALNGDDDAISAQRVNAQLNLIMTTIQTIIANAAGDAKVEPSTTITRLSKAVLVLGAVPVIDLSDIQFIASIVVEIASDIVPNGDLGADTVLAIANAVGFTNSLISDPSSNPTGDVVVAVISVSQSDLRDAVRDLMIGNTSLEAFEERVSPPALFNDALVAVNAPDYDEDGLVDIVDSDDDNDGTPDKLDAFPLDPAESLDTDGDGIGNNADTDDDGDGVADSRDPAPLDNTVTPPTAIISADRLTGLAPQLIKFDAGSSLSGNASNTTTQFRWTFGDGERSFEQAPRHIYKSAGTYEVVLRVTNNDRLSHSVTETVEIEALSGSISIGGKVSSPVGLFLDSDVNESKSNPISNDDIDSAQPLANPSAVSGYVNLPGEGPDYDGEGRSKVDGDVFDVFRFSAYGGETIQLIIADKNNADLDLYLFDEAGDLVAFSVAGVGSLTETVVVPSEEATYYAAVEAYSGGSNYNLVLDTSSAFNSLASGDAELVLGDIVLEREADALLSQSAESIFSASISSRSFAVKTELLKFGSEIAKLSYWSVPRSFSRFASTLKTSKPSDLENKLATFLLAKRLSAEKGVKYAEPNFILRPQATVPNDNFYSRQWHYPFINLPQAWDVTTGDPNVVVAVIDSGVVHAHPDIRLKITPDSYDFISDASSSGDGDGYDSNASDPGDGRDNDLCSSSENVQSSFHGTHVAGTIAASTNNSAGAAGVSWSAKIMDLRVLGCSGGTNYDLATSILYAAGLPNASDLLPARPADIINMSLGSPQPSRVLQEAIQAATEAGLILVAAAGNDAQDGNPISYPASYENVISVGAVQASGEIAAYSNYNEYVDLSAPGGNTSQDIDADGIPDGVISLWAEINESGVIEPQYTAFQGTSMAAPHVSGVIALMKSVYPDLTSSEFNQLLLSGSITDDAGGVGRDDFFGQGIINASKGVLAALSLANGEGIPENPLLAVSNNVLLFGQFYSERAVRVYNAGTGDLSVVSFTSSDGALTVTPPDSPNGLGVYVVRVDREGLADGLYSSILTFTTDSAEQPSYDLAISYEIDSTSTDGNAGVVWINVWDLEAEQGNWYYIEDAGREYDYVIDNLPPGLYTVYSGTDPDNDGFIGGVSELLGGYPTFDEPTLLIANRNFSAVDIPLSLQLPIDQLDSQEQGLFPAKIYERPEACNKKMSKTPALAGKRQKCAQRIMGRSEVD
jgi:serine protease